MSSKQAEVIAKLAGRSWLSLSQVATLIGVSYPTALAIMRRGELKAVRVGKIWRVYEEEIQRYLVEGSNDQSNDK